MHREVIRKTANIALAFPDGFAYTRATGLHFQAWTFTVANSGRDSQELLLRLFTDYRTRPVDVQVVLGALDWAENIWNLLPRIAVHDPEILEKKWSVYAIRLQDIPSSNSREDSDSMTFGKSLQRVTTEKAPQASAEPTEGIYTGSAQAQEKAGLVGESQRLILGHERYFTRPADEIVKPLYVHKIGRQEGVQRSYYSLASFPVIEDSSWYQARIKQSIQRLENDQMIILGSLSFDDPDASGPRTKILIEASRNYTKAVRPHACPRPPWYGLNRVLPSTQQQQVLSKGSDLLPSELQQALEHYHTTTNKRCLGVNDIQCLLEKDGKLPRLIEPTTAPTNLVIWLRAHYQRILKERGLQYEAQGEYVRRIFPILWGIVQHLVEADRLLVSITTNTSISGVP